MRYRYKQIYKILLGLSLFSFGVYLTFALDTLGTNLPSQRSTFPGSNNSTEWFSTGSTLSGTTSYWNKNNDSDTIGNFLRGYYYDTQFGFFLLDWSSDSTKNVRIIGSTDKCGSGYGYKFGGYAQSNTTGYIKFDYDANNFVYYCERDKKLHGYAYSTQIGFQGFEGLSFEIIALVQNNQTLASGSDPFFVNNNSLILINLPVSQDSVKTESRTIQGKRLAKTEGQEVFFYIVK